MSLLLHLESEEVRMVGIWGPSGIGKTTIARALFSRLSRHFHGRIFIDRRFISKNMDEYRGANSDDYNMKLSLQESFLSEILGMRHIQIDHLGAVEDRLKHRKVLIFIDDLDDQVVLDVLVGQAHWFGSGSRIIVITKDKHFLRAHGIDCIYEVCLPSEELALKMLCRSAFRQNSPPNGFEKLAVEVARHAGSLPLGLTVLGSSLRGRNKEYWIGMLPRFQNSLDTKIEKTLRISYDGLDREEDKAIYRHIACLFSGAEQTEIKLLLDDSNLGINIGIENLLDKSLIHVRRNIVEMHNLLQEIGRKIVREESIEEPGNREFLVDSKDIFEVLNENTGTKKVLGISLDMYKIHDQFHVHENAFKRMSNLRFLKFYTFEEEEEVRLHLNESFDYLPPKLRLLHWDSYPMRFMPSKFRPENLVILKMQNSQLEKLWEGDSSLTSLKEIDMSGSKDLKEITALSRATNLETLELKGCSSLVELPSSVRNLSKLGVLNMSSCTNLETLPTGMNLEFLNLLNLHGCLRLRTFPDISRNISTLILNRTSIQEFPSNFRLENIYLISMKDIKSDELWERDQPLAPLMTMLSPSVKILSLSDIPSLVELPSSFQNLHNLTYLYITNCKNLESLPTGINLESLDVLDLSGCSRLKNFPDISNNISSLNLSKTGIEEVPWWIENFSNLNCIDMVECKNLKYVSLNISKLKHLEKAQFSYCGALTEVRLNDSPSGVAMATNNIHSDEASSSSSSSLTDSYIPKVEFNFSNCFNLNQEALLHQQFVFEELILSGEQVPYYFTHRTTETSSSLTNIPIPQSFLTQRFFRARACAVVDYNGEIVPSIDIQLRCRFKGRVRNHFDSTYQQTCFYIEQKGSHLFIFDCLFALNKDDDPIAEVNYDHVDLQLHTSQVLSDSTSKLKGWGIRLLDDFSVSSPDNRIGSQTACEDNMVNETKQSEEHGGRNVETERNSKRMRISNN